MKYLILSNKHELIPFSQRLRREGQDVEVIVAKPRYERAWDGKANKLLKASKGQLTPENLELVIEAALKGDVAVMTNLFKGRDWFLGAPHLWGTLENGSATDLHPCNDLLQVGGWLLGDQVFAPHLFLVDWGTWPGGMGPWLPGSATLCRFDAKVPEFVQEPLRQVVKTLTALDYRGLFRFTMKEEPDGELVPLGIEAGWHPLHSHAFLAELDSLSALLQGGVPQLGARFVTVLLLTVPPWPSPGQGPVIELSGLTPQQRASVWWHDVTVDSAAKKLCTAGLDGLVGVAVGSSHYPELARARALEIALRIELPEKQYRSDVGSTVPQVLAGLEDRFGVLI